MGWWAAGLLLVALILFAAHPVYAPGDGEPEPGPAPATTPAAPGPAPDVDLSSMTPREAADRLFDRVMRAASAGDSVEVRNFLPMAIGAYDRARPLDADGLFHLSLLYRTGLQPEPALAAAREGLADDPDHLLLLSAASEAALAQGDTTRARSLAEHLLDVYEAQVERGLEEYRVHATLLPRIRDDAEALAEGSGPP